MNERGNSDKVAFCYCKQLAVTIAAAEHLRAEGES